VFKKRPSIVKKYISKEILKKFKIKWKIIN
jgi:hypothetical protein